VVAVGVVVVVGVAVITCLLPILNLIQLQSAVSVEEIPPRAEAACAVEQAEPGNTL
jgi:hypothetical protein